MKNHPKLEAVELDEGDAPLITSELIAKGKVTVYPRPAGYKKSVKDGVVTMTAQRGERRPGTRNKSQS